MILFNLILAILTFKRNVKMYQNIYTFLLSLLMKFYKKIHSKQNNYALKKKALYLC